MGAYGEFIGAFAELFEEYKIVKATAKVGGGYNIVDEGKTVYAYVQSVNAGVNVRDNYARNIASVGSSSGVVSIIDHRMIWTYEPLDLQGGFIIIDDEYYRAITAGTFIKEGGFYEVELHRVTGNVKDAVVTIPVIGNFE